MNYLFIYIKALLINLFIVTVISGILIAIFPHVIILLAWIILFIGSFINASKKVKSFKMEESKVILNTHKKSMDIEPCELKEEIIEIKDEKRVNIKSKKTRKSIFETIELDY